MTTTTTTTTCKPNTEKLENKILYVCFEGKWVRTDCEYVKFLVNLKSRIVLEENNKINELYNDLKNIVKEIIKNVSDELIEQYNQKLSECTLQQTKLNNAEAELEKAVNNYIICVLSTDPIRQRIISWLTAATNNSFFNQIVDAMATRNASALPQIPNYVRPARGLFE